MASKLYYQKDKPPVRIYSQGQYDKLNQTTQKQNDNNTSSLPQDARMKRMTQQFSTKRHNSIVWAVLFALFSVVLLISGSVLSMISSDIIAIILIFSGISLLFCAKAKKYKSLFNKAQSGAKPVPKIEPTGSVDSLEKQAKQYIQIIKKANDEIPSEELSSDIDEIEKLTGEIFNYAIENKNDKQTLRRFFSYYLPVTLKLLQSYVDLEKIPLQTQQVIDTKKEIADMLGKIKTAFATLYEQIMQAKAMDISTEISAMENIMTSEGLINPIELDMKEYQKVYEKADEEK